MSTVLALGQLQHSIKQHKDYAIGYNYSNKIKESIDMQSDIIDRAILKMNDFLKNKRYRIKGGKDYQEISFGGFLVHIEKGIDKYLIDTLTKYITESNDSDIIYDVRSSDLYDEHESYLKCIKLYNNIATYLFKKNNIGKINNELRALEEEYKVVKKMIFKEILYID